MNIKKFVMCGMVASMVMGSSLGVFANELPDGTDKSQIKAERLAQKEAKKAERLEKLSQRAADKGMSVDDLIAKIDALKAEAESKGLTFDEFKAQRKAERESKKAQRADNLAQRAEKQGITVDELIAQIEDFKADAESKGIAWDTYKAQIREERHAEKEATKAEKQAQK